MIDSRVAAPRRQPAQPGARRRRTERRPSISGGRGRPRRHRPSRRARRRGRRRRRVQPRRPGEPRRLDGRSAVRPRREHHEPVPLPRAVAAREPADDGRVYTSTRQIFGKPRYLPVDEDHPVAPVDVNGITKYATEQLHLLYHDVYGLARDRGAAHQRVRAAPAACATTCRGSCRSSCARALADDADHGVRRRCAAARLPLRRRRGRVPAARRGRRPRRRARSSTSGTTSDCRWARSPTPSSPPRARAGSSIVPWPPDRDAIDIGSYFGDSSKAKRMLGWEPRTSFAAGIERTLAFYPSGDRGTCDRRRVTGTRRVPVVDLAPPSAVARARAVRRGRSRSCGRARTCSVPSSHAFEAEFAAFTGRRHAVGVASGTDALRLALVALGHRPRRRGARSRVHRGAHGRGGVRGGGHARVRRRRPRHRDASTSRPRAAAVTERTRAVDPGAPVRAARRAARSRRADGRGRRAGARRARPRRGRPLAAAYSFYPTKNLGGITDGGAVVTDDDDARGDASACCVRTASPTATCTRAIVDERADVRDRGGASPRRPAGARCRERTAAAKSRDALPAGGARPCAGRRRTRGTCTTSVSPGSPDRDDFRARVPFDTALHYPAGADAAARLPAVRAGAVPGSRTMGGGVRIAPMLSRNDRRRDRGSVPSAPVNPAVEAVSVFFPCYNDEATIASMVEARRRHDGARSASTREVIVINDGSTDGSAAVLDDLVIRAAAPPDRRPTSATRDTAAVLLSGFATPGSNGSSTPTVTGSTTPPSSSCWCSTRPTTSTWCRGTSCAAPTACCGA